QCSGAAMDWFGAAGPAADAEVLYLACAGLAAAGIENYRLVIGHLGAALQLLSQLGMREHGEGLVLDLMEPIARGRHDPDAAVARVVDLLGGGASNGLATAADHGLASALALPPT